MKKPQELRAVFPGSFDPLTFGHTDIINRALNIFDKVIVGVLDNPGKKTLFSVPERESIIKEEFRNQKGRVVVESFSGLLVDFVKQQEAQVIIRGLRAISDYDYEAQMALMNKTLADDIETFFVITSAQNAYISSSLVRQIAQFGGSVAKLVPEHVDRTIRAKFQK